MLMFPHHLMPLPEPSSYSVILYQPQRAQFISARVSPGRGDDFHSYVSASPFCFQLQRFAPGLRLPRGSVLPGKGLSVCTLGWHPLGAAGCSPVALSCAGTWWCWAR